VVDVSGSVRSAAATALGFAAFDPQVTIAGVIANRAGGTRHVEMLRDALQSSGLTLLGAIPWDDRLRIPERHLGLVPAPEAPHDGVIEALSDTVSAHIDLDALIRVARTTAPVVVPGPLAFPPIAAPMAARIGVAQDEAFSFYYQDNLEMLESFGAQLRLFSPIRDRILPDVDGLYLGGGFPEVYARELAENAPMRREIAAALRRGMPVYAECGGLLYLCRRLVSFASADADEESHEMAGVVAATARMKGRLVAHDYVTLEAASDTLLLRRGESVRGHEFHWSVLEPEGLPDFAYHSSGGRGIEDGRDGIATDSLLATYAHVHFAARPEMAQRLVDACRRFHEAYKE
ncbi:MAG: cobyrinate a,c-diamide synthase, partial [bacterium]